MKYKFLILALLASSCVQAAEVTAFNDSTGAHSWRANENVMRPERRQRCAHSATVIFDALRVADLNSSTSESIGDIKGWLNGLRSAEGYVLANRRQVRDADSYPLIRQTIGRPEANGTDRNFVDDALYALSYIETSRSAYGGLWAGQFAEQIHSQSYGLNDVLAMVWTFISNNALFNIDQSTVSREIANMKSALLRNLAEMLEDDGHTVCDVGISQRIVLTLQGYLAGVAITADVDMYNANAAPQISADDFINACSASITGLIQQLPDTSLLNYVTINMELNSLAQRDNLIEELKRIKASWVMAFNQQCSDAPDNDKRRLMKIFDEQIELINNVKVDVTLTNCPAYNADHYVSLYYDNSNSMPQPSQQNTNASLGSLRTPSSMFAPPRVFMPSSDAQPSSFFFSSSYAPQPSSSSSSYAPQPSSSYLSSSYAPQPSSSSPSYATQPSRSSVALTAMTELPAKEGDTKTLGANLMMFKNGRWIRVGRA